MFNLTKTFTKEQLQVTPILFDGDPIFLPQEIGQQIGFSNLAHSISNSDGLLENIDYKTIAGLELKQLKELVFRSSTALQIPEKAHRLTVLTESGFYAFAFRSNKPECVKFRIWVTDEVLPQIRKTGSYQTSQSKYSEHPLMVQARTALEITAQYLRVEEEQKRQAKQIHEIEAKTTAILDQSGYYSVMAYARISGVKITLKQASAMGRSASRLSKEQGIEAGSVPDPRFGRVGTYQENILEEVFAEAGLIKKTALAVCE